MNGAAKAFLRIQICRQSKQKYHDYSRHGGRELLEKELIARGANVTSCLAYQSHLADTDTAGAENLLQREHWVALIAGSYETITNFKLLIDEKIWPSVLQTRSL